MFEPTRDRYGRAIWTADDPVARTADRKPIVHGMRVFTNNLDRGVVDLTGELTGRGAWYEFYPARPEWDIPARWVLWFDVVLDTSYKGEPKSGYEMQSDDRVATRFEGKEA